MGKLIRDQYSHNKQVINVGVADIGKTKEQPILVSLK